MFNDVGALEETYTDKERGCRWGLHLRQSSDNNDFTRNLQNNFSSHNQILKPVLTFVQLFHSIAIQQWLLQVGDVRTARCAFTFPLEGDVWSMLKENPVLSSLNELVRSHGVAPAKDCCLKDSICFYWPLPSKRPCSEHHKRTQSYIIYLHFFHYIALQQIIVLKTTTFGSRCDNSLSQNKQKLRAHLHVQNNLLVFLCCLCNCGRSCGKFQSAPDDLLFC